MRSLPHRFGCAQLFAAALALSGCGGSHDDLTKRLVAVQSDLTRLQRHSERLEERLEALEMRKESAPISRGPVADPVAPRPRLTVVKLEPGENREPAADAPTAALRPEDSVADPSPRPMIRVYGSRTEIDGAESAKRKR